MIFLVVATAELALVAALGSWQRWLIIHGAIAVIALIVFIARFGRRGRNRATGAGVGTNRRGRGLAGLLGGRGRGHGASGHGTGGGHGRGRGLAGLLGGRGRGTGHGASGHGTGDGHGRGRGLGNLFGGRGRGTGTGGHGTGNGRSGRGNGLGGLFGPTGNGRRTDTGGHGNGRKTGSNGRGNNLGWDIFGDKDRHDKDKHGKNGKKDDDDHTGFLARTAEEFKKGWDAAGSKDKKENPDTDPDTTDVNDTDVDDTTEDLAGKETPDTPATPQGGPSTMVKTHGTPSLQAWGRCLPSVEAALLEKQRELRRTEADLENIAQAVIRLQNQGEQELPASPKLVALLDDIQTSLNKLPKISEVISRIASNANVLGSLYRTEHTGDEDRLAGMRGGVEKEKRSDVSEAQKDT